MTRQVARTTTSHRPLIGRLALTVVAMFGFGYALVPLYDMLCEITGINGKTGIISQSQAEAGQVDSDRWVTVEFTGSTMQGLPWEFRSNRHKLRVHPGDVAEITFYARNRSQRRITGQAVPSVAPSRAAAHFKKTECFCFTQQVLEPGEEMDMPVRFVVQASLPKDVHTITLSYAFFKASQADENKVVSARTGNDA